MNLFNARSTRSDYLEKLHRRYSILTLPIATNNYHLPLQAIFQPLKLRREPLIIKDSIHNSSQNNKDTTLALTEPILLATNGADALRQSVQRRMVILGGPGMGKTTLLQELLRQAIQQAKDDHSAPLPIFISLPDLARSGLTLQSYLPKILAELAVDNRYANVMAEELTMGNAFLCLDSLDEVMPALRPDIITLINRDTLTMRGTWIIGSRFTEYKGGQFAHSRFAEWELQPLDATKQLELVERLLPVLTHIHSNEITENHADQGSINTPDNEDKYKQKTPSGRVLLEILHQDEKIASWGENPLLLSLATVIYVQTGALSSNRAVLYGEIINTLLSIRITAAKQRAELRLQLANSALLLYQTRGRNFTIQELLALPGIFSGEENAEQHAIQASRLLNSGVLDVVAYQTYSFKHQMFQEYLAALSLAHQLSSHNPELRQTAWNFVWSKRTYSRWREILRLLVSILVQEYAEEGRAVAYRWLEALAEMRKQPEGDTGNLCLLLALQSLSEISFTEEDITLTTLASELVVIWVEILIDAARNYYDPRWKRLLVLAHDIRLFNKQAVKTGVELLVSALLNPGEDEHVRSGAASTLGELGWHAPIDAFFACLRTGDFKLRQSIEYALKALGNRTPLEPLVAALRDIHEDWRVRKQAAHMLGQLGRAEAVEALVETTSEEGFHVVCNASIEALGQLGEYAPTSVLIALLYDADYGKSLHAAKALGELGQVTAMEPLLDALHDRICEEAAQALIKLPVNIPYEQLLTWLGDENTYLQLVALEKLALSERSVPIEQLIALLDNPEKQITHKSALLQANKQKERLPAQILLRLLNNEERWSFLRAELKQAFYLLGSDAPIDALVATVDYSDWWGRAGTAFEILEMLQHHMPIKPLFAQYYKNGEYVDIEWVTALIRSDEGVSAEELITIAHDCTGRRDAEYGDELAIALGELGADVVDALLAKIYNYGFLEYGILPKVARIVYEHIPEDRLIAALQKSEGDICTAIGIVGLIGNDHTLELLLSILKQLNISPAIYCSVLSALRKFGTRVPLDVVLTALQHENYSIREETLHILQMFHAMIDMSVLVEPLKEIITSETHSNKLGVLLATLEALGLCGEHAPIDFLITLLEYDVMDDENANQWIRLHAADTLAEVGQYIPLEPLYTMLVHELYEIRELAAKALGKQKERVRVERILMCVYMNDEEDEEDEDFDEDDYLNEFALNVLQELEADASNEILEIFLQHEDEKVRKGAQTVLSIRAKTPPIEISTQGWITFGEVHHTVIERLVALGELAPFELLLAALDENNEDIHKAATRILDELARIVPTKILAIAPECDRPGMRKARLRAWSMLEKSVSIGPIIAGLSDKDNDVGGLAIELLGDLRHPAAIEPLTRLLQDGASSILILNALGKLGTGVPVEPLRAYCGHRWYESYRYLDDINHDPGVAAAEILKRTHPDAFGEIIPLAEAMLRGELPAGVFASRTQSRIADAIGAIGRAEPSLLVILDKLLEWPYWQVRMKAAEALGEIRRNIPDSIIRHLLEIRHDPQSEAVRKAVDNALAEILALENSIEDE